MFILLDYYIPYAGLCNQIYLISNHITEAIEKNEQIFVNKMNIDIFNKKRIPASEIIDIDKTNKNLNKEVLINFDLNEVFDKDCYIPNLRIYPVTNNFVLSCITFHEKYYTPFEGYGIHFRIDIDCLIHYLFDKESYNDFIKKVNISPELALSKAKNLLLDEKVKGYINYLFKQYVSFMVQLGFDKPWYICTPIGKDPYNNLLQDYLDKFINFIKENGGTYEVSKKIYDHRELNALVDLLVLKRCERVIGFEGSSFSEGYVYKVNTFKNKMFRFINPDYIKLNNELYNSS